MTTNAWNSNVPVEIEKGGTASTSFNTYGPVVAGSTSTSALTSVSPSATTGIPLVSQGSSANPSFSTAVVAGGGTGATSLTAYAVICGGTTSTGAVQSIASVGSSGQVLTSNGAGALPTFQAITVSNFSPANIVVAPTVGEGDYTTLTAALAAASPGDTIFVREGTYVEDLTLVAGVNIASLGGEGEQGNVTIQGKCSFSGSGTVTIYGLKLQTNSDYCISVTGSSASSLILKGCSLIGTNNTLIQYTSSSSSSEIQLYDCTSDLQTTGIALYSSSGAGTLSFSLHTARNSGASTTLPTFSAGTLQIKDSSSKCPIAANGGNINSCTHTRIDTSAINTTALTISSSGSALLYNSGLSSGTAAALSVGSGTTVGMYSCNVSSSNANPVTGAGTFEYSAVSTNSSTGTFNPSTLTGQINYPGIIRTPNQPLFSVFLTNVISNVTGDGTVYTIIYDTVIANQGSSFNTGTGTYTAPLTGCHQFNMCQSIQGGTAITVYTGDIVTSNNTYRQRGYNQIGSTAVGSLALSVITDMDAGDTASVTITTTDTGGKVDDLTGSGAGIRNFFSAFLYG